MAHGTQMDGLPPITPPDMAADLPPEMPSPGITLSPEQANAAGLTGAQPGDTYTATLTVQSNDEAGLTVEITDAQAEATASDEQINGTPPPKSRVLGPAAFA